jgi:hypothetical protein
VLAVGALPGVRAALSSSAARVVWICNLEPQIPETAGMSAADHLNTLRRHGLRVDAALFDPAAPLHFTPAELGAIDIPALAYPLVGPVSGTHDPVLLAAALDDLFSGRLSLVRRSRSEHFPDVRPMGADGPRCDIGISHAHLHDPYRRRPPT